MEKYNAVLFYAIARTLENLVNYGQTDQGDHTVTRKVIARHIKGVKAIAKDCKEVGLKMSSMYAEQMLARLRKPKTKVTHLECSKDFEVLQNRIHDEMSQVLILRIPSERANRWDTLVSCEFIGRGVKFPSTTFDAFEAGHCFAAGRFTACVFHLMCILEIGLRAFAEVFKVPADHKNWHNIIEGIESKIRNMGHDPKKARNWKVKQEKYAQAASSFMFFKARGAITRPTLAANLPKKRQTLFTATCARSWSASPNLGYRNSCEQECR